MISKRTKRKAPMTFVNRGGKGTADTFVDEVEPGGDKPHGVGSLETERARPGNRASTAGHDRSPSIRSSRV